MSTASKRGRALIIDMIFLCGGVFVFAERAGPAVGGDRAQGARRGGGECVWVWV
jgi:hypothetical protein